MYSYVTWAEIEYYFYASRSQETAVNDVVLHVERPTLFFKAPKRNTRKFSFFMGIDRRSKDDKKHLVNGLNSVPAAFGSITTSVTADGALVKTPSHNELRLGRSLPHISNCDWNEIGFESAAKIHDDILYWPCVPFEAGQVSLTTTRLYLRQLCYVIACICVMAPA